MERSTTDKQSMSARKNFKIQQRSECITNITHTNERGYKSKKSQVVKHLNIDYFKLMPCNNTQPHNHKNCMNYHNAKDKKRMGNFYSETLCKYIEEGKKCPHGDECTNAHSRVEQLYRADKYKIKFCAHYPNNISLCEYGDFCSFAHSQAEINTALIHNYEYDDDFYMFHYKTVFCPLNLTEHDKARCVYAHNWQDYRRSPQSFHYQPIACGNWKPKDFISDYGLDGCEHQFGCVMCHGWKELEYHPLNYRTKKCPLSNCKKGECHYYHTEKEKRVVTEELLNSIFRLVARNRLVEGTYKYDYNTGFTARKALESPTKTLTKKDNTVVYLSLMRETDRKAATTFHPKANQPIIEISEKGQWIEGSKLHQSDPESDVDNCSDDEKFKQNVDKLVDE